VAITNYYVHWDDGNDYSGATFDDGEFDSGTFTLTKNGAFADSQVHHWLYLDDDGSGEVTAGYYRVTTVNDANSVVLHADIRSGANDPTDVVCTQHDGSAVAPWRSLQGGLDLVSQGADGDQFNVSDAAAQVLSASLTLARYGAPAGNKPLALRGYTAAANDGGMAEIDCSENALWTTQYSHLGFIDLDMHSYGNNHGIYALDYVCVHRCHIHRGASNPSGKYAVYLRNYSAIMGSRIYDVAAASGGCVWVTRYSTVMGNYIGTAMDWYYGVHAQMDDSFVTRNVILHAGANSEGLNGSTVATNNIVYCVGGGGGVGIKTSRLATNNVIVGESGVGGYGVRVSGNPSLQGANAFFNCTANNSATSAPLVDITALDVALAADPFVDAANDDFALTEVAKAALRNAGFPAQIIGPLGSTPLYLTIGASQHGPDPGPVGGGGRRPRMREHGV